MSQLLYCQVTSKVRLASFYSLMILSGGYAWLPLARCLSTGWHTPRYPSTTSPSAPQKSLFCVCVGACLTMSLVCAAVCESERMLVCMYVTVFLQALALATITFDGYLFWLWRAVCFPVDESWGFWRMPVPIYCHCSCSPPHVSECVCVCESMNNYPVHRLVVVVVSSFCLWTFHSSLKQQTRRVKRERGNHSSLMTHLDREKWGNFSAGKAPQSWFPGDAAIVMWLDY